MSPNELASTRAARLNQECLKYGGLDKHALNNAMLVQGTAWHELITTRCPHIFAAAPVFISQAQWQQMQAVVATAHTLLTPSDAVGALGVCFGYDFHLNAQGAHLIEINTNAGGAFLNAMLIESQREAVLQGESLGDHNLAQELVKMFRYEWRLAQGDIPLKTIAIVDEQPDTQYLYPEFLLAQTMLQGAGIAVHILAPENFTAEQGGLYYQGQRIDLIYNRLTDFSLQHYPALLAAWQKNQVVLTPNPYHYQQYADKHLLVLLTDAQWLQAQGASATQINILLQGIPVTRRVNAEAAEQWWAERKQWFFKPVNGYGSKGAYRGDKLTKRVFEEIMQADYVAQQLAMPSERMVCVGEADAQALKYDVRCYVYDGHIQMVAARLYQGQTTNFRTVGGGFALVRVVE